MSKQYYMISKVLDGQEYVYQKSSCIYCGTLQRAMHIKKVLEDNQGKNTFARCIPGMKWHILECYKNDMSCVYKVAFRQGQMRIYENY